MVPPDRAIEELEVRASLPRLPIPWKDRRHRQHFPSQFDLAQNMLLLPMALLSDIDNVTLLELEDLNPPEFKVQGQPHKVCSIFDLHARPFLLI